MPWVQGTTSQAAAPQRRTLALQRHIQEPPITGHIVFVIDKESRVPKVNDRTAPGDQKKLGCVALNNINIIIEH